jgi:hypothetical protein
LKSFQPKVSSVSKESLLCGVDREEGRNCCRLEGEDRVSGEVFDDESEELRMFVGSNFASFRFGEIVREESVDEVVGRIRFDLTASETEGSIPGEDDEGVGR